MRTNLKGQRKNEGVQEIEAHLVGRNKVPFLVLGIKCFLVALVA